MDKLSIEHHIQHLEEKHRHFENYLIDAESHFDDMLATKIKKEKLAIKDEIEEMKTKLKTL